MNVCVLTTSYPRHPGDVSGGFVADAVIHLRAAGIEVGVVSPATFRHYGIAYGDGIANNLRARPWKVLLLPLFMLSFARAARRAARGRTSCTPTGCPRRSAGLATRQAARRAGVGLGRRAREAAAVAFPAAPATGADRRLRLSALADDARALGARDVRVIPSGVDVPDEVGRARSSRRTCSTSAGSRRRRAFASSPTRRPACRSSSSATARCGDLVPAAVGFVPHGELGPYYERAAVVCVPSRREGYGFMAREAMAYGRAVVTTAVGGIGDAIEDGVTGVVVPARDDGRFGRPSSGCSPTPSCGAAWLPRPREGAGDFSFGPRPRRRSPSTRELR